MLKFDMSKLNTRDRIMFAVSVAIIAGMLAFYATSPDAGVGWLSFTIGFILLIVWFFMRELPAVRAGYYEGTYTKQLRDIFSTRTRTEGGAWIIRRSIAIVLLVFFAGVFLWLFPHLFGSCS